MNPGVEVRVKGQPLNPEMLEEVRVEQSLMLPDAFAVQLLPEWEQMKEAENLLGAEVEILLAGPDARSLTNVLKGQILALEPRFGNIATQAPHGQDLDHPFGEAPRHGPHGVGGAHLAFAGYDHSHLLNRTRRTETYQNMTLGDIARKVASNAKFDTGTIDSVGQPRKFVQQNNETDWEFLWKLAKDIDFEVIVIDKKLNFRKAGSGASATPVRMEFGTELFTFNPRITGVQQLDEFVVRGWDVSAKEAIEGRARVEGTDSNPGISRSKAAGAAKGGTLTISDRPVTSTDEANDLAKSLAAHHANAYVSAEGACHGDPSIRPGTKIEVRGLAPAFDGVYTLSGTKHLFRGGKGFETHFTISGRTPHRLVDLTTPARRKSWGNSVVLGKVTQNQDPDKLGRVRVMYPALSGNNEGNWARVVGPASGKDRGLMMMPQVGEEVVVAFEHDDVQFPYVLGSVWNGKDTPGDLAQDDGSFVLQSDKFLNMKSKDSISIKGEKDLTIEIKQNMTEKVSQSLSVKADQDVKEEAGTSFDLKAGTSMTIKGGSTVELDGTAGVTIKCGGAKIALLPSGTVQISGTSIMLG
jgi:phage protein D/phage baseplate assembly protein gpV